MKTLIVGSRGYVGSVLIPVLKTEGISFIELDADWFGVPNPKTSTDIRSAGLSAILDGVDIIIYLAAVSNDPMGNKFEGVTHDINAATCYKLACAAKMKKVKKFIFASSCSMYGSATDQPKKESDELSPLTAYARSKVWAERNLRALADEDFKVISLRFATACGVSPNLRLDLVLNDFVASAVTKQRIDVLSDGTPWRPLVHVDDMARAFLWAIRVSVVEDFLPVNIGSYRWTYQIKELAEYVADLIPNTVIVTNKYAAPDKRSYKVSFARFEELAPDSQPLVSIEKAVSDLEKQIREIGFGSGSCFRNVPPFSRLHSLERHISENKMNERLFWV